MKRLVGILSLLILCSFVVVASEITTSFVVNGPKAEVADYVPPCAFGNIYISYAVVLLFALVVSYGIWKMGTGSVIFKKKKHRKKRR
jgi:hypothetical protein